MKKIILFCLVVGFANGQLATLKKGLARFELGDYDLAIKDLLNVKDLPKGEEGNRLFMIAECYRLTNRLTEAAGYYEKAIAEKTENPSAKVYYADALKAKGKYTEALGLYQASLKQKGLTKQLQQRTNREIANLKGIEDLIKKTAKDIEIKPLSINSAAAEFSPYIVDDLLVYSASTKPLIYTNGLPFTGIFAVKTNRTLEVADAATLFSGQINEADRNEASITISKDGNTLVFARGNSGKRKDMSPDVDLYVCRKNGTEWSSPSLLRISDSLAWDGSPAFSADGKVLYFASNRIGGQGGLDLWQVGFDGSKFTKVSNMGKAYNTVGNEMFPFQAADGQFYFASDGHPGLGRLDLFNGTKQPNGRIVIENLGTPFNSPADDFGLFVAKNGTMVFASDREGGKGSDDLYAANKADLDNFITKKKEEEKAKLAELKIRQAEEAAKKNIVIVPKVVNYLLAGTIRDSKDKSTPLEGTKVKIMDGSTLIKEFTTAKNGRYGPLKIELEKDYVLVFEKDKYLIQRAVFSTTDVEIPEERLTKPVTDTMMFVNANLDKIVLNKGFALENIYYDLDKADIREDAAIELDRLVQILEDNPGIKIELGSHTDTRSSDVYNLRLSQRRADAAVDYMISKGIEPERIKAKGYGETQLIVKNAKTEEEHQTNRRTEFKVLELADGTTEEEEN